MKIKNFIFPFILVLVLSTGCSQRSDNRMSNDNALGAEETLNDNFVDAEEISHDILFGDEEIKNIYYDNKDLLNRIRD